jgi:hypothetical protein
MNSINRILSIHVYLIADAAYKDSIYVDADSDLERFEVSVYGRNFREMFEF